jgi:hypothetical protein
VDHRWTTDTKRRTRGGHTMGGGDPDLVGESPWTGRAVGELVRLLEPESRPGATAPILIGDETEERNEDGQDHARPRLAHWFIGRAAVGDGTGGSRRRGLGSRPAPLQPHRRLYLTRIHRE